MIKDGSTVRSEFAYYVPRILNRTVRTPVQFLKHTVPRYTVPVPLQKRCTVPAYSSVARGGGGAIAPPISLPTKMQNKENSTFLALLRLSFALD